MHEVIIRLWHYRTLSEWNSRRMPSIAQYSVRAEKTESTYFKITIDHFPKHTESHLTNINITIETSNASKHAKIEIKRKTKFTPKDRLIKINCNCAIFCARTNQMRRR